MSFDQGEARPLSLAHAASALRPRLESRLETTEELRRLPEATISDLEKAGLFGALVPRKYGGLETSLEELFEVVQELGQADGSVAWTYAVLTCGSWMVASFFPESVSATVFTSENALTSAVMVPSSFSAEKVDGGMLVHEARWRFNTGIHHAGWTIVGIPLVGPEGFPIDLLSGLVPTGQLTIDDDWYTSGLRGTGSSSAVARDLFVPAERLVSHNRLLADDFPSGRASDAPLYNMAVVPTVMVKMASPAIAIARGALSHFVETASVRGIAMTFQIKQSESAVTHLQVGEAEAKIDAAETVTRRSIAELERAAATGKPLTVGQRARIWRDAGFASRLAWEAIDLLASASGGSFALEKDPINHAWRDARVATSHAGLNPSTAYEIFGRIRFGLPSNSPLLP